MKKTFVVILISSLISCNHIPNTTNKPVDKPQQVTQTKQDIIKPEKYIDFFGVGMCGDFNKLLDSIDKTGVVKVDRGRTYETEMKVEPDTIYYDFAIGEFCGCKWGLNVKSIVCKGNKIVTSIHMLTSEESQEIIDSTYNRLCDYYGEPYDHDIYENRDVWYMSNYGIVSRYLHVEEGGRTIYFDLNNF